jgi:hypothetical protein
MRRFTSRNEAALYVWDYFYIANVPAPGDDKVWAVIERAVCRIRSDETELDRQIAVDLRIRAARRFRNSVRVALRQIEQLRVKPDQWVVDELAKFEALADDLIERLSNDAKQLVLD